MKPVFNTVNCFIAELRDDVPQARLDSADSRSDNDGRIPSSFEQSSQSSKSGSAPSQTSIENFFKPKPDRPPAPGPLPRGDGSNLKPKKQKQQEKPSVSNQLWGLILIVMHASWYHRTAEAYLNSGNVKMFWHW